MTLNLNMASNALKVYEMCCQAKELQVVYDGITAAKQNSQLGINMSAKGFLIMDIVQKSIEKQLKEIKAEIRCASDINLI